MARDYDRHAVDTLVSDTRSDKSSSSDTESEESEPETYTIRPPFKEKFNSVKVKEILKSLLIEELEGKWYNSFNQDKMVEYLKERILEKLLELPYIRYKYIINVMLAEKKGQATSLTSSCLWDPDTDNISSEFIITQYVVCVATVFGVYYY